MGQGRPVAAQHGQDFVNGQEEPKKLRDGAWLFQPELIVDSPDGKPNFHSRPPQRAIGKSDPVAFAEEQEMAMLYRHQTEFGVGHGGSIHADCPEGICDRAVRLTTKVVPSYEVPQTTPPTIADFPKLSNQRSNAQAAPRGPSLCSFLI